MTRTSTLLFWFVALAGCDSCSGDAAPSASSAHPSASAAPASVVQPTSSSARPPELDAGRVLPTPPLSELARRQALLDEGRSLERSGAHAEAMDRYEQALAIAPGDSTLLGELGWAQFHAGQLDDAYVSTSDALSRAGSPHEEAMMLYNLGRIAEAAEHASAALELYRRSMALRPNAAVRARIVALHGTPPASGEVPVESWVRSFVVEDEPVATLADVCALIVPGWQPPSVGAGPEDEAQDEAHDEDEEPGPGCTPQLGHAAIGARGVLEAGTVTITGRDVWDDAVEFLVARTTRGWFVVAELGSNYYGPSSLNGGELSVSTLETRDVVPGDALELFVRTTSSTYWADWCEGGGEDQDELRVCGVLGDDFGCWLDVVTRHASRSGTWRDGEGWTAGMDPDEAARTCDEQDDDEPSRDEVEPTSALGAALDTLAGVESGARAEETIEVTLSPSGSVTFEGSGPRPTELSVPIPLASVPCLGPLPDVAFDCAAEAR